jgi:transcriptional regulator GlxA family with amidase domain
VCTGALVYAAAGLLRNRPATTYWAAFDELLALDPSIEARRADRFVDDGDVITAAGVSAGIDMALTLAAHIGGDVAAQAIQLWTEYDPRPPFDTGSLPKASPEVLDFVTAHLATG